MLQPRLEAAAFLLVVLATFAALCRPLVQRAGKPAVIWITAAYWALLHLICLYGLLTSTRFDTALAPLTLFTFPANLITADTVMPQGFSTLHDLAVNYVRYVLDYGVLDALLLAGFLAVAVPGRRTS